MNNPSQPKSLISIFSERNHPNNLPNIPAGLRGEAVRSALCDPKKGLWYELSNPKTFQVGTMKVKGSGTLDFLHSKFTNSFDKPSLPQSFLQNQHGTTNNGIVRETCFLTAKGRTIDTLSILLTHDNDNKDQFEAHILTSPMHYSGLYDKLNPFVFPMDGIQLQDCTSSLSIFSIMSTTLANAQAIIQRTIIPALETKFKSSTPYSLPPQGEGCIWTIPHNLQNYDDSNQMYIMEHGIMLPPCAARGYTILIPSQLSYIIKDSLNDGNTNSDSSDSLPMEISTLEWESLRIESGTPGYGNEMTGDFDSSKDKDKDKDKVDDETTQNHQNSSIQTTMKGCKSNPLELHLQSFINLDKGCYQGQEGVSSILKNKRGSPRTLYTIVFDDDENSFHENDDEDIDEFQQMPLVNRQPIVGDELYVLGSNEKIQVGIITSVAEPGSTGKSNTIALALLRRPDSILKKMKDMELDFGAGNVEDDLFFMVDEKEKSRQMEERIQKESVTPADPLHGLEVIVKGTYTMGKVEVIATRSAMDGKNLFDDNALVEPVTNGAVMGYVDLSEFPSGSDSAYPSSASIDESTQQDQFSSIDEHGDVDDEAIAKALEEANKAAVEAEKAAAEAKRKAEKMELLRQRAEAAMARRKKKKEQN